MRSEHRFSIPFQLCPKHDALLDKSKLSTNDLEKGQESEDEALTGKQFMQMLSARRISSNFLR